VLWSFAPGPRSRMLIRRLCSTPSRWQLVSWRIEV
jgi:hypothetical protein